MSAKEVASHWRALARVYHTFGFNVVPLGADKRPVIVGVAKNGAAVRFKWEDWHMQRQEERFFDALLAPAWWTEARGVAAVCGPVSGNLACIDFDDCHQGVVEEFLRQVGLPPAYAWTVTTPGGGFHVWLRTTAPLEIPKGKVRRPVIDLPHAFIEVRWTGHYAALPGSHHPAGGVYRWAFAQPDEAPATL